MTLTFFWWPVDEQRTRGMPHRNLKKNAQKSKRQSFQTSNNEQKKCRSIGFPKHGRSLVAAFPEPLGSLMQNATGFPFFPSKILLLSVGYLFVCLFVWLVGWLVGWFVGWFVVCWFVVCWFVGCCCYQNLESSCPGMAECSCKAAGGKTEERGKPCCISLSLSQALYIVVYYLCSIW